MLEDRACSGGRVKPMDLAKSESAGDVGIAPMLRESACGEVGALGVSRCEHCREALLSGEREDGRRAWEVVLSFAKQAGGLRTDLHQTTQGREERKSSTRTREHY